MKSAALTLIAITLHSAVGLAQESKGALGHVLDGLSLDLRTVEDSNGGIALDFDWSAIDVSLDAGYLGDVDYLLSAKLSASGIIGSKPAASDNTPRSMDVAADLDLKVIYGETDSLDDNGWIGLTAAEFEADQDWNNINYSAKPFVQFDVPYSRKLSKGMRAIFGAGNKKYLKPLVVRLGYSFVSELESDSIRDAENRFELMALYSIETYKSIRIKTHYRFYSEEGRDYDLVEITVGFPITHGDADAASHLVFKYVDGELPLSLRKSESLSVGWSVSL
jgi:hypothetical protein